MNVVFVVYPPSLKNHCPGGPKADHALTIHIEPLKWADHELRRGCMSDLGANGMNNNDLAIKDYFVEKDGVRFAGLHLLIEFWEAENLNDVALIEAALSRAAKSANATVLTVHAHKFSPNGVTGIAILAESHISIHTWPERGFAAIDVFMCGSCNPFDCIAPLKEDLKPKRVLLSEHKRGVLP